MFSKRPPRLTPSSPTGPMLRMRSRTRMSAESEVPSMQLETGVRRQGAGYAAEGAGFYAWDEDPETLRVWATALRSAAAPASPPAPEPSDPADPAQKRNV